LIAVPPTLSQVSDVSPPIAAKEKTNQFHVAWLSEPFSKLCRQQQQLAEIKENISLSGSSLIAVPLTLR